MSDTLARSEMPNPRQQAEVLARLLEQRASFLAFLERRTGSREDAEDLLQEAYVRGVERIGSLRDGTSASAWFYGLLRNSLVDRWRHRAVERRAAERLAEEAGGDEPVADPELMEEVCRCVEGLVDTLKPEYASMVRRVTLQGVPVGHVAAEAGITANNASVRLHRAHAALKRAVLATCGACGTHGCLDCDCRGVTAQH